MKGKHPDYLRGVAVTLVRDGYGSTIYAAERKFAIRCHDLGLRPSTCGHWLEVDRCIATIARRGSP
jgi:hypothetical protein